MFDFLNNFNISPKSFWLGLLSGLLLAWVLSRISKSAPGAIRIIRQNIHKLRESFSIGNEVRLRNDIYRFAQKQHITSSIFSLDEIIIEPNVLTPLIDTVSSIDSALTDSVSLSIPYTPDCPDLATIYQASTLSLLDALQGNANVIIAGHPGCGKTVALAWLAASIAKKKEGLGKLSGLLPLYVHATDVPRILDRDGVNPYENREMVSENNSTDNQDHNRLEAKVDVILDQFIQAISCYVSPTTQTRLSKTVHQAINNQRAIVILDCVDELPANKAHLVTEYVKVLLDEFPSLRVIISMSYADLAGLPSIGFKLLGLAGWTAMDQSRYLNQWNKQWLKWISHDGRYNINNLNPYFLNSWLTENNTLLTPLEFALKVWAAFAGDIRGTDGPSSIEAYIRRMVGSSTDSRIALEQFSLYLLSESDIAATPNESEKLISKYKSDHKLNPTKGSNEDESLTTTPLKIPQIKKISEAEQLSDVGILKMYPSLKFGFSHPVITGYLAGHALATFGVLQQILEGPAWIGKNLAFYYFSRYDDVSYLLHAYLQEDDELYTNLLQVSTWLKAAPKNRPWRSIVLRRLTSALQKERETESLSVKLFSALLFSGDAGVVLYFRQLIKNEHQFLRQLGALGCGVLGDLNSIDDLNLMLQEPSPGSIRCACLALAAIGDKRSLEILASILLGGSETARRYSAEALANHPSEGFQALNEGSTMDDLLVRRAVIYGLIRINQPWARKIIENLQLDDKEWVVRNAAIQAFDEVQKKSNLAPMKTPDLPDIKWLNDYAIKNGTTVAPGLPGEKLIQKALSNGNQEEVLSALDYYRSNCDQNSIELVYNTYKNSHTEIRNSAYFTLWLMTLAGLHLPLSFK